MTISNSYDNYWKQQDSYDILSRIALYNRLLSRGFYKVKASRSKAEFTSILRRHDSGRTCYDKYSDEELVHRVNIVQPSRKASLLSDGTLFHAKRLRFIRLLEKNDDDSTIFHRFLDLPAELRNRVYEFYVEDFPRTLKLPTKPPLSRTCRLLCQEVLPIFYANLEFEIHLSQNALSSKKFSEDIETQMFLVHLSLADVACIRKLKLVINQAEGPYNRPNIPSLAETHISYHIELNFERSQMQVTMRDRYPALLEWWDWTTESCEHLTTSLLGLSNKLDTRQGRKVFRVQDIHGLRGVVEEVASRWY